MLMEQNKRFNIIKYNLKELQRKLRIMIVVDPTMTMAFELVWLYTGQGYRCPSVTQKGPLFDQSPCASIGSSNPKLWYLRAFTNRDSMDEPCRTLQLCYASVVQRKKLSV